MIRKRGRKRNARKGMRQSDKRKEICFERKKKVI